MQGSLRLIKAPLRPVTDRKLGLAATIRVLQLAILSKLCAKDKKSCSSIRESYRAHKLINPVLMAITGHVLWFVEASQKSA